jgi:hypothetical protein
MLKFAKNTGSFMDFNNFMAFTSFVKTNHHEQNHQMGWGSAVNAAVCSGCFFL